MGNRMLTETLHARLPVLQNRSLVSPCFLDTGKKKSIQVQTLTETNDPSNLLMGEFFPSKCRIILYVQQGMCECAPPIETTTTKKPSAN